MPKRKSKFEKMALNCRDAVQEIPNVEGVKHPRGRILIRSALDTWAEDYVHGQMILHVEQKDSCGTLFLEQEQGEALARILGDLFIRPEKQENK